MTEKNPTSDIRTGEHLKIRRKALKLSASSKLSPKTIVFRSYNARGGGKRLNIEEHFLDVEGNFTCKLEVKSDPLCVLPMKEYTETASSKTKALDKAFTAVLDYLKS